MRTSSSSMRARPALLPSFEARSVALFSVLLVGAVLAATAQAQPASNPGETATAASRASTGEAAPRMRLNSGQVLQAFQHIDNNRDGSLSRAEVGVYPRIERHFERIDSNRDGTLSPTEFEEALQQAS